MLSSLLNDNLRVITSYLDPASLFVFSLVAKPLHALFKQKDVKASVIQTSGIGFLSAFRPVYKVLSPAQLAVVHAAVKTHSVSICDFLFDDCAFPLQSGNLLPIVLESIRNGSLGFTKIMTTEATKSSLVVKYRGHRWDVAPEDIAEAMGESGSREVATFFSSHYELLQPEIGIYKWQYLQGLTKKDAIDLFSTIPLIDFHPKDWAIRDRLLSSFVTNGAIRCFQYFCSVMAAEHFVSTFLCIPAINRALNNCSDPATRLEFYMILLHYFPEYFDVTSACFYLLLKAGHLSMARFIAENNPLATLDLTEDRLRRFREGFMSIEEYERWRDIVQPVIPQELQHALFE
jgi:hypothetical protein